MTEYDFSPEAYERHMATQHRIANWVESTEEHRLQFGNAFKVQPSLAGAPSSDARTIPQKPAYRRHRSSDTLRTYGNPSSTNNIGPADVGNLPSYYSRSQPPSRSSSRHRSSSKRDPVPSGYLVTIPPSSSRTYVYAPPGWAPSSGLVIIPPSGRDLNVVFSPPTTTPQQPYRPSNLGSGVPAYPPQPIYPQAVYPQPVPVNGRAIYPPPQMYPAASYPQGPSPQLPGPYPYPQPQAPLAQPQMMYQQAFNVNENMPVEIGRSGRKIKKVKKSKSEIWFRRS